MIDVLLLAIFVLVVLYAIKVFRGQITIMKTISYKRLYIQCVARLDMVAVLLNKLKPLAEHLDDSKALQVYESALSMMESLLVALNKVPLLPTGRELVGSLEPMIKRLESESNKALMLYREAAAGLGVANPLIGGIRDHTPPVKGCYFCSRPYSPKDFKKVGIRIAEKKLRVFSCPACRASLKARGTADVLFFKLGRKNVHWSEVGDYDPTVDFWTLGKRRKEYERPKLRLILTKNDSD